VLETTQLSEAKSRLLEKYRNGRLDPSQVDSQITQSRQPSETAPLDCAQEQIWLQAQRVPHIPLFNESVTIHYRGPLDVAALVGSLNEILRRHQAWRTSFSVHEGRPIQVVHRTLKISLPVLDLQNLPEGKREAEALRIATEDARQKIDLTQIPLFRTRLVRLGKEEHRLFLTVHQIILDGISVYNVLLRELSALYKAFLTGCSSPIPELRTQYADFAQWHRGWLTGEVLEHQVEYWRKQLAGHTSILKWPNDFPRPTFQTFRGAIHPFTFPASLSKELGILSRAEGVTLFVTLLAAFTALLHSYTRQKDIVVGTVAPAGRKRPEVQGLLGYFLNPVAIRTKVSGDPSFGDLLRQTQGICAGALSNDDVPFQYLVEKLQPSHDPSRNPFFQVAISQEPPMPPLDPAWDLTPMDIQTGGARWDLYLVLDDRRNGILGRAQYNPDLFKLATIRRMLEHYQALLQSVAANPEQRMSELARFIEPCNRSC